jgi:DMSO/TMAO reductase YedYZ molybdopterin-dependent catalytic subunit
MKRRTLIAASLGTAGLAAAARIASEYGLIPPDSGNIYGPGATLTYGVQSLLTRHSLAREFTRGQISKSPFANGRPLKDVNYLRMQAAGFADWRLAVEGMVSRPGSFSLADLHSYPASSQITQLTCEEGWSYIAEWTGVTLSHILQLAGALPQAKYVVYFSIQPRRWDSIDMADALHPQTLVAYAMNGAGIPAPFGGPMRMRVPRQLGYKSIKFLNRIVVTDNLKSFGKGLGSSSPESGYSWYAGI